MIHYSSFNLPNKRINYCHDLCNYMSLHGLMFVLYVIRVEKSTTANICRPYSSSNRKQIVNIRKRKICYFILNSGMTLLVCRSFALNNKSNLIRSLKFRVKRHDITTQQHIGYRKYAQTFINMMRAYKLNAW